MTTSQANLITLTLDKSPGGVFDTITGGGVSAEPTKHRPGGMKAENVGVALPTYGDVTIGRELDLSRDLELRRRWASRVGRARATINKQPLDGDGAPFGKPTTYTGRLSAMTDPESDSNSGDRSMFEMTFVINGRA